MRTCVRAVVSVASFVFFHMGHALAANAAPAEHASAVPADVLQGASVGSDQATLPIAQPVDEIVDQHLTGRGGYVKVKSIQAIDYAGTRYVGCEQSKLSARLSREASASEAEGLDPDQARAFRATFDFDGPLIDWKKKNYTIERRGMEKLPGILAWKLEVDRPNGYREILYLNSHKGDLVRESIEDSRGQVILDIWRHDFRDVDGTRFPFAVDYKNAKGDVLVGDRLTHVEVKQSGS